VDSEKASWAGDETGAMALKVQVVRSSTDTFSPLEQWIRSWDNLNTYVHSRLPCGGEVAASPHQGSRDLAPPTVFARPRGGDLSIKI
jgi:hypothetical protein